MAAANMHPFYRLFFQKLDPLIMIWSGYFNLRNRSFSSTLLFWEPSITVRDVFVLEQVLALMAAVAAMVAVLLHYSDDINVWRIVQVVLLVWNFSCLNGTTFALLVSRPLARVPGGVECVYCLEVCTVLIIIRIMFLLGVGNRRQSRIKNGVLYRI